MLSLADLAVGTTTPGLLLLRIIAHYPTTSSAPVLITDAHSSTSLLTIVNCGHNPLEPLQLLYPLNAYVLLQDPFYDYDEESARWLVRVGGPWSIRRVYYGDALFRYSLLSSTPPPSSNLLQKSALKSQSDPPCSSAFPPDTGHLLPFGIAPHDLPFLTPTGAQPVNVTSGDSCEAADNHDSAIANRPVVDFAEDAWIDDTPPDDDDGISDPPLPFGFDLQLLDVVFADPLPITAEEWKIRGNELYSLGRFEDASRAYTQGILGPLPPLSTIRPLPRPPPTLYPVKDHDTQLRAVDLPATSDGKRDTQQSLAHFVDLDSTDGKALYLNRAACSLKLSLFDFCLFDTLQVLSRDPINEKALLRAASASYNLCDYEGAERWYTRAAKGGSVEARRYLDMPITTNVVTIQPVEKRNIVRPFTSALVELVGGQLVTTRDVEANTVLAVEKAVVVVYDDEVADERFKATTSDMVCGPVRRQLIHELGWLVWMNPSLVESVLAPLFSYVEKLPVTTTSVDSDCKVAIDDREDQPPNDDGRFLDNQDDANQAPKAQRETDQGTSYFSKVKAVVDHFGTKTTVLNTHGIFPLLSTPLHSCSPSALLDFRGDVGHLITVAKVPINTPITIDYCMRLERGVSVGGVGVMGVAERMAILDERFGWRCGCERCASEIGKLRGAETFMAGLEALELDGLDA